MLGLITLTIVLFIPFCFWYCEQLESGWGRVFSIISALVVSINGTIMLERLQELEQVKVKGPKAVIEFKKNLCRCKLDR